MMATCVGGVPAAASAVVPASRREPLAMRGAARVAHNVGSRRAVGGVVVAARRRLSELARRWRLAPLSPTAPPLPRPPPPRSRRPPRASPRAGSLRRTSSSSSCPRATTSSPCTVASLTTSSRLSWRTDAWSRRTSATPRPSYSSPSSAAPRPVGSLSSARARTWRCVPRPPPRVPALRRVRVAHRYPSIRASSPRPDPPLTALPSLFPSTLPIGPRQGR